MPYDKEELFTRARSLFLNQMQEHLHQLYALIDDWKMENGKEMYEIVHKLKGTSYMIDFPQIGDISSEFIQFLLEQKMSQESYHIELQVWQKGQLVSYIHRLQKAYEELA